MEKCPVSNVVQHSMHAGNIIYKYRVYCNDEERYLYQLADKTPTCCPHNHNHTIDPTKTIILESVHDTNIVGMSMFRPELSQPVYTGYNNELMVDVPKSIFGLLKTQLDTPVIQVDFVYNISHNTVLSQCTGTGHITHASSHAVLNTGASANSSAVLTTRRFVKYRPGQGVNVMFTAVFTPGVEGSVQLAGVGTPENGFFFMMKGTEFGVCRRSNGVDHWIPQHDWNCDPMDGDGKTTQVLDVTKGNVYRITYQWLGYGAIVFMVEETNTGVFVPVHRVGYANTSTETSVLVPSFPVRYEVSNTTNETSMILKTPCCAAMVEGCRKVLGPIFSCYENNILTDTTLTNMLTIRNMTTYCGLVNYITIYMRMFSMCTDGGCGCNFVILKDAQLGGGEPEWTLQDVDSVVECTHAQVPVSGGRALMTLCCGKTDSRAMNLADYDIFLDPGQVITVAAQLVKSNETSTVTCSLSWVEDR